MRTLMPLPRSGRDATADLLDDPLWLAEQAVQALRDEAMLSPKPALVDARGSGAHTDLDLPRMLRSAEALRLPLQQMAEAARGQTIGLPLRQQLAHIGRVAEQRMLMATGGSNAHRGAIWALGLLLGAAGSGARSATELCRAAASLARLPDPGLPQLPDSHGLRACRRHQVGGARAQARAGFPHALRLALPMLRQRRAAGCAEPSARLDALLAVMAELDDTCLLHRGGRAALQEAQRGARHVLQLGGAASSAGQRALLQLDAALLARNASPGGSADLLAVTLFLDRVGID